MFSALQGYRSVKSSFSSMAAFRNESREMEESFAKFSIEDEEQEELVYGEEASVLSEIYTRWCLWGGSLLILRSISKPCIIRWLLCGDQGKECMLSN